MLERVLEIAKELYPVSGGEEKLLENLCRVACGRLDARLRADAEREAYADAYVTAAVWLVMDGMGAGTGGESVKRFSAGDLTIERGETESGGLASRAWALMEPYLKDEGFVFRGVRG